MKKETKEKKVVIAIPTNRPSLDNRLAGWLYRIKEKDGYKPELIFKHQQPIDCNRNAIVYDFLNNKDADWLLFIDDDMIPKFEFEDLFKYDKKVVSALTVVMSKGIPGPLIMKKAGDEVNGELRYTPVEVSDLKNDGTSLIPVDGVGTGCLLIHRSVLEKLEAPWFSFERTEEGEMLLSEDYHFSRRVRDVGVEMFVDSNCICGHGKYVDLHDLNKLLYRLAVSNKVKVAQFGKDRKSDEEILLENQKKDKDSG